MPRGEPATMDCALGHALARARGAEAGVDELEALCLDLNQQLSLANRAAVRMARRAVTAGHLTVRRVA